MVAPLDEPPAVCTNRSRAPEHAGTDQAAVGAVVGSWERICSESRGLDLEHSKSPSDSPAAPTIIPLTLLTTTNHNNHQPTSSSYSPTTPIYYYTTLPPLQLLQKDKRSITCSTAVETQRDTSNSEPPSTQHGGKLAGPHRMVTGRAYELTLARLDEFTAALTSTVDTGLPSLLRRSGGRSGERGAGLRAAARRCDRGRAAVVAPAARQHDRAGARYYRGWRRMWSEPSPTVPRLALCGEDGAHECPLSWKFDDAVEVEIDRSVPDGDEDAILGMLLLVVGTAADEAAAVLVDRRREWTYQAAAPSSTPHRRTSLVASNGEPMRA